MNIVSDNNSFEIVLRPNQTWFLFVNRKIDNLYNKEFIDYVKEFIKFINQHIYGGMVSEFLKKGNSWEKLAEYISNNPDSDFDCNKIIIEILIKIQQRHNDSIKYNINSSRLTRDGIDWLKYYYYSGRDIDIMNDLDFKTKILPFLIEYMEQQEILKKL